jgi:putative SOS response-associated peptidase YedK
MCFYYAIVKKEAKSLIQHKVISNEQLSLFKEAYLINGFQNPHLPVVLPNHELVFFEWGLVPEYITNPKDKDAFRQKYNTLNAKSETVFSSKMYATAIRKRRCLVICSGFFEWREFKGKKYPYYITLKDDDVFVFGGIYNPSLDKETGEISGSYSIITTPANALLGEIHNTKKRMPLIIEPADAEQWLDPGTPESEVKKMMKPFGDGKLKAHTIQKFVPSKTAENNTEALLAYYHYPELSETIEKQGDLF